MEESTNRSLMTTFPALRAGTITSAISCAREAAYKSISVTSDISSYSGFRIMLLTASPITVPPGSLVITHSRPVSFKYSFSNSICVDLPEPSGPSITMNIPFICTSWPSILIQTPHPRTLQAYQITQVHSIHYKCNTLYFPLFLLLFSRPERAAGFPEDITSRTLRQFFLPPQKTAPLLFPGRYTP